MTVLAWQRAGTPGRRAVVLLHDWAEDATQWERAGWIGALTDFDVLACDLPGHGGSSDIEIPDGREPAAWSASAILADLHHLRVTNAAAVGVGVGAVVAGHLGVTGADVVARLVLVASDDRAIIPHAEEVAAALRSDQASVWHPEAAALVARARESSGHDPAALARWAEAVTWPAAPRLGSLRTPTLLAVGQADERHERAPRLAALFHDGRMVSVPGDGADALASSTLVATVARFIGEGS